MPGAEIATIPSISKGIYEQEHSIYNLKESDEEQKIFQVNDSIRQLIDNLDNKSEQIILEQQDENKAQ